MRRFRRVGDHRVQLRLPATERQFLVSLLPQLRAVLDNDDRVAHLRGRLFPPAYDDAEQQAEFSELIGDDLVAERNAALTTTLRTLDDGRTQRGRWIVEFDDDTAAAWLTVLHDLRLVLAQIVGITEEADWERDLADASPEHLVLWHVGGMQEELIEVLATSL